MFKWYTFVIIQMLLMRCYIFSGHPVAYMHGTQNPIYVFPEMKLRGLVPTSIGEWFIYYQDQSAYLDAAK